MQLYIKSKQKHNKNGGSGASPDVRNKITRIIGGMYCEIYILIQHIKNGDR